MAYLPPRLRPEPRWHYHADLACGHTFWFDMGQNLFLVALEEDPEADIAVNVGCPAGCGKVLSTSLAVTPGTGPCEVCIPGSTTAREEAS